MAKGAKSSAEKLAELISGIEAEAYARGRADARKALADLLTAGSGRGARGGPASGETGREGGGARKAGRRRQTGAARFDSAFRRTGAGRASRRDRVGDRRIRGDRGRALDQDGLDPGRVEQRPQAGPVRVGQQALVARARPTPAGDETGQAVSSEPSPAAPPDGGAGTAAGSGQGEDSSAPGQGSGTTLDGLNL